MKNRNTCFVFTFLLFFMVSCAHQSGKFVRVPAGSTPLDVAKNYGINSESGLVVQDGWVFIPMKKGIMQFIRSQYDEKTQEYLNLGKFAWPVPAHHEVSSSFGHRWGRKHDGIDITANVGDQILAAEEGEVIYSGNKIGGYGNITIIQHSDGFYTVYAHAKKNYKERGEKVKKGELIALVGMTGRTTGPHLHFEIRRNSESLDPRHFLSYKQND